MLHYYIIFLTLHVTYYNYWQLLLRFGTEIQNSLLL